MVGNTIQHIIVIIIADGIKIQLEELSHVPGLANLAAFELNQMNLVFSKHICENMRSAENYFEFIQCVKWLPVARHSDLSHLVKGTRLEDGQLVSSVRAVKKAIFLVEG